MFSRFLLPLYGIVLGGIFIFISEMAHSAESPRVLHEEPLAHGWSMKVIGHGEGRVTACGVATEFQGFKPSPKTPSTFIRMVVTVEKVGPLTVIAFGLHSPAWKAEERMPVKISLMWGGSSDVHPMAGIVTGHAVISVVTPLFLEDMAKNSSMAVMVGRLTLGKFDLKGADAALGRVRLCAAALGATHDKTSPNMKDNL